MYEISLPDEYSEYHAYSDPDSLSATIKVAKEQFGANELGQISIVNKIDETLGFDDSRAEMLALFRAHAKVGFENFKSCAGLLISILLKSKK